MSFNQVEYRKEWYQRNKESVKERGRRYYIANRERIRARVKANKVSSERSALYRKRRRTRVIKSIFDLLGYKCVICHETDKHVLQIDHIEGGGRQHAIRANWAIGRYYGQILKSIQEGCGEYRTLCSNCNIREGIRKGSRTSIWDFPESFFATLSNERIAPKHHE